MTLEMTLDNLKFKFTRISRDFTDWDGSQKG